MSFWQRDDDRLALLELWRTGKLRRRAAQAEAHAWLAQLPWIRVGTRRSEIVVDPTRRDELVALLERVWPEWRDADRALAAADEPPTPAGWARVRERAIASGLPLLPARLNRRTAAAAAAGSSKRDLTSFRRSALGAVEVFDDGIVRLRGLTDVYVRTGSASTPLAPIEALLGEVALPERALADGLALEGPMRALVTVENLGAWRDMPCPPNTVLAHVPGWDTATVRRLLSTLGALPILHFGDLDPAGVGIVAHLRAEVPHLRWFVPACWADYVASHGQARDWPAGDVPRDAPRLVLEIAAAGLWLEQEVVVLDPRFEGELEAELIGCGDTRFGLDPR